MNQVPSIGRIVHYRLSETSSRGEYAPALILRVNSDSPDANTPVNLLVFHDNYDVSVNLYKTDVTPGTNEGQYVWPTLNVNVSNTEG